MSLRERVRICAHVWAYAATQPSYDVYGILERIFSDFNRAGLEGVELMENCLLHEDSYSKVSKLSRKYRVPVIGSSFGGNMYDRRQHKKMLGDAEKVVSILSKLGSRKLGISTGEKYGGIKSQDELDIQAEALEKMKEVCEGSGIVMNLHNHIYEVKDGEYELKENIKRIPDIKLGPDLNWLLRAGIDPFEFLRRYRDRIVYMHVRDQRENRWTEALGEGDFDIPAFKKVLEEIEFRGDIAIELAHERDHKFVRSMGENFELSYRNLDRALRGK
ncbi:MAG: sugar phosphate isomerase/epimerase family protein [Thermoproteota archaeon]